MYVFRARYACMSPWIELDGDAGDMALAVEEALGMALCDCLGIIIVERIQIAAHLASSRHAFTLHLEVRSPDYGTHIWRASQGDAQHAIEVTVLHVLRELFGPVLTEETGLTSEAPDAAWGEVAHARSRRR
jgi:hypothetical protein